MSIEDRIKLLKTLVEKHQDIESELRHSANSIRNDNISRNEYESYITYLLWKEFMQKVEKVNKMIEDNIVLVPYIINKNINSFNHISFDELISIGNIGLLKASYSYNPKLKTNFSTYSSKCILNEILMFFRKDKKFLNDISFEVPIFHDENGNILTYTDLIGTSKGYILDRVIEKNDISFLATNINTLTDNEKYVVINRFGLNGVEKKQCEIAKELGISQSYVSVLLKKALTKLKNAHEKQCN